MKHPIYRIRDNFYQIVVPGKGTVFQSYDDLVLVMLSDGRLFRSSGFVSITTERHISNYLVSNGLIAETLDLVEFNKLAHDILGD